MVVKFVRICSTDTAVPPGLSEMLEGDRMMVGTPTIKGVTEPVKEMFPLKPPMLVRVTLTCPTEL